MVNGAHFVRTAAPTLPCVAPHPESTAVEWKTAGRGVWGSGGYDNLVGGRPRSSSVWKWTTNVENANDGTAAIAVFFRFSYEAARYDHLSLDIMK